MGLGPNSKLKQTSNKWFLRSLVLIGHVLKYLCFISVPQEVDWPIIHLDLSRRFHTKTERLTSISSFSRGVFSSVSFGPSAWLCCSSWSVCILICREAKQTRHVYTAQRHQMPSWKEADRGWTCSSLSLACSVSIGSSVSSDFCTSTREALDTLKIPWMFTRTLTLILELSPDACGTTFWMRNWPVRRKTKRVRTVSRYVRMLNVGTLLILFLAQNGQRSLELLPHVTKNTQVLAVTYQ